jgi:hypothetical protein
MNVVGQQLLIFPAKESPTLYDPSFAMVKTSQGRDHPQAL